MSVTLNIPVEIESAALNIPDLQERFVSFIRQQICLEEWRRDRYSDTAKELLAKATAKAATQRAAGETYSEAADRFQKVHDRITSQI
jgi:hypothetical protein